MNLAQRTGDIPFSSLCAFFDAAEARQRAGEDIINMVMGRPDFLPAPHIGLAIKKAIDDGEVHYTSNYGLMELRREVARKLREDNGLGYAPETEILITAGVSEGLHLCMAALLDPGDEALIPSPSFLSYGNCVRMASGVPVFVSAEQAKGFQPEKEALERAVTPRTKLILINSPQNPTGTVYTPDTLQAIAEVAIRHDLFVVSDEINEKIVFDGEKHVSIASLPGMRERTVVLNGFSKAYAMTGSRIGYAAGPERLISPIYCCHQYTAMCPCTYAQWGAVAALRGPQDHMAAMVAELDRRRLMLLERLQSFPGVSLVRPKGAFYIMVTLEGWETPREAAEALLDAGLAVVPWDERHLRISYANAYDKLSVAMDRMEKALTRRLG